MRRSTRFNRREALKAGLVGGVLAALPNGARPAAALGPDDAAATPRAARGAAPRNIIFMVADGMSLGLPSLLEPFARRVLGRGTSWNDVAADPQTAHGYFDMASLSSLVTDSSAASSSWGSGSRVFNGVLNVLPDQTPLTPIAQVVHGAGRRVGLVTTTTITHATPAGFAAVQPRRDDEPRIAPQYLGVVDVLLGGGRDIFDLARRADHRDLRGEFAAAGYVSWEQRDQVLSAPRPEKVLGLFTGGHLPFTLDQRNTPALLAAVPTLAEMSRAALAILRAAPQGFLLQIEGGRVDHAAHANDAAAALWDLLAFDDALGVVREFVAANPDTLVIVTTDHGNSNPGLNGMGAEYRDSAACLERLGRATASFGEIGGRIRAATRPDAADAADATIGVLKETTGCAVSAVEAAAVTRALRGDAAGVLNRQHAHFEGVLGEVLSNHTGIGWIGTSHTADLAPLMAFGPGAVQFTGLLRNTAAYDRILALWDTPHKNPEMSPEAARKYLAAAPPFEAAPHWV